MFCITSISKMFRGIPITEDLICSILGKPMVDKGKKIGTIIGVNQETDTISMEIDDCHVNEFIKISGFEIVGG